MKEATGSGCGAPTVIDFVVFALPAPLVAVNLTVYVPAVANLCVTLLVAPIVVLSPKSQDHEFGALVLVSVNVNVVSVVPVVDDTVKEASGSIGPGEPEVTRGSKSE